MFYMRKVIFIIVVTNLAVSERRITGGKRVTIAKPYMVYIVWEIEDLPDNLIDRFDTHMLCGGVIISTTHILTSAACLLVKRKQFVVAGYNRYVPNALNDTDVCVQHTRRRLISKCYYIAIKAYKLSEQDYYQPNIWPSDDIGIGRVDIPFDSTDDLYREHCSYIPKAANLSFRPLNAGENVVVLGWGNYKHRRPAGYNYDVNQEYLMGTSTIVIDEKLCTAAYPHGFSMNGKVCTDGEGKIEVDGTFKGGRRDIVNNTNQNTPLYVMDSEKIDKNKTVILYHKLPLNARKNGPCENDHGGPLVTWIAGEEHVAGIVVGYLVNDKMECVGPQIYRGLAGIDTFIECMGHVPLDTYMEDPTNVFRSCKDPREQKLRQWQIIDWN